MTAEELNRTTLAARTLAGVPSWDSPETPGASETLLFRDAPDGDRVATWALGEIDSPDDCLPLDTGLVAELLKAHFRGWLLERGWQVQVILRGKSQRWRLVDCLSIADGGGDRLDTDYPFGDDELTVLCESVVAVVS